MKLFNISEDRYDELPDDDKFDDSMGVTTLTIPMQSMPDITFVCAEEYTDTSIGDKHNLDLHNVLKEISNYQRDEFINKFISQIVAIPDEESYIILMDMVVKACQMFNKSTKWAEEIIAMQNKKFPTTADISNAFSQLAAEYNESNWLLVITKLIIDSYNAGSSNYVDGIISNFLYLATVNAE